MGMRPPEQQAGEESSPLWDGAQPCRWTWQDFTPERPKSPWRVLGDAETRVANADHPPSPRLGLAWRTSAGGRAGKSGVLPLLTVPSKWSTGKEGTRGLF